MDRKRFLLECDRDFEHSLAEAAKVREPYYVRMEGLRICVFPNVFDPTCRASTRTVTKSMKLDGGETVLDIGTGSGILSVLAVRRGASKVTAVDVNPDAIRCARFNFRLHKVSDRVALKRSDLFSKLGSQKFDVILFNPPERVKRPRNAFEKTFFDYKMRTVTYFLRNAGRFLNEGGRVYLAYGDVGEIARLENLMKRYGYRAKTTSKLKSWIRTYVCYDLRRA